MKGQLGGRGDRLPLLLTIQHFLVIAEMHCCIFVGLSRVCVTVEDASALTQPASKAGSHGQAEPTMSCSFPLESRRKNLRHRY